MKVLREMYHRLRLQTPLYFARLQRFCLVLAAVGAYLKQQEIDFTLAGVSVVSVLIGAGVAGVIGNGLPVKDYDLLQDKISKK